MQSLSMKVLMAAAAVVMFSTVTAIAGAQGPPPTAGPLACVPGEPPSPARFPLSRSVPDEGRAAQEPCPPEPGPPGPPDPPALALEYGVAAVDVTRGGSTATFGVYSTALGSPVIDTTGGTFRFTCDALQAPCFVAVKAAALSDSAGTALFYPRILIERTGTPTVGIQPTFFCEYADGSSGPGGLTTLTKQPKAVLPDFEAVEVNIGGSADCGLPGPGGDVASIEVPEGFYNVDASFSFR